MAAEAKPGKGGWRRNLATTVIILIVLAVLTLGLEYVVTYRTEALAASQIEELLKTEQTPKVTIYMHPILVRLFQGRVDEAILEADGFKLKYGLDVQRVRLDVKGVKVDFWELFKTRRLSALKSMDSGSARIVLSEEAVNALVAPRLPGAKIKLERGRFRYQDDISTLVTGVMLDIPGQIAVKPGNVLQLQPLAGEIDRLDLPDDVKGYLRDAFTVDYVIYDIPEGIELTKITLQPGQAVADAKISSFDFLMTGVSDGQD